MKRVENKGGNNVTIRYGIVSAAQIVPRFVAGVKESQAGEVVAIAATDIERAQQLADELAIPSAYGSYQELFADETVDVVYVATYNQGHYEAAKQALLAGKHVLVEKPFVLSWDEADELFALAAEKQRFLMEAQKALFLPVTKWVKEQVQSGVLGTLRYAKATMAYPHTEHIKWFPSLAAGGGALRGSSSYPIHYLMHVLEQDIDEASGTALMIPGHSDTQCDVSVIFDQQLQANLFITTHLNLPSELTLYGELGQLVIPNFWKAQQATLSTADKTETFECAYASEFVFEIDHVNECLAQGLLESPVMTKEMTLQSVELAEQLYEQWTAGDHHASGH